MPGTESQKAFDLLEEKFPAANAESATARVVLRAPQGRKLADAKEKAEVENLVARLGKAPEVVAVSDPFEADTLSEDGTTGYAVVTCKAAATELDDKAHDALTAALLGFVPVKVMPRAERKRLYGKPLSARQQRKADKRAARRKPNLGSRWAAFVVRRPLAVLFTGVVGLGVLAVPAASLQLGLPSEGTYAKDTTQRKAYDMLSDFFGAASTDR
jgi:uncharacterized membrane protein YdfJ with MMPL/SSD domain